MKTAAWDFVSVHAEMFGIKRICRVLEVSRSGYYRWIAGAKARAERQAEVTPGVWTQGFMLRVRV